MCMPNSGSSGAANRARKDEKNRKQQIQLGTNTVNDIFGQYDEGFFQRNLANPFLGFALPQFEEQRRGALGDLIKGLATRGLLSSSVGARARNEFNDYSDRQRLGLEDQARSRVDQGLAEVEQQRNNIITQLNATADAQAAIQSARNQAALLGRPPTFSPLGALFANFSSTFLNNRNNPAATAPASGGGASLFSSAGGSGGSGRVVGGP